MKNLLVFTAFFLLSAILFAKPFQVNVKLNGN